LPEEVFGKCTNLEEVTLSSNVKTIGNNAFTVCSNLTKINLENVKKIKTRAFYNNTSLSKIDLTSLETLEQEAFSNNRNLSKVKLGNLLKNIQKGAFKNSRSLKEIDFNQVQTIEDEAFKDSGLRTLTMTNEFHRIGKSAFENVNFSDLDSLRKIIKLIKMKFVTSIDVKNEKESTVKKMVNRTALKIITSTVNFIQNLL